MTAYNTIDITPDTIITANPEVHLQEEPDKWGILYLPRADFSFVVDPVSAFIWKQLTGSKTVGAVCEAVRQRFAGDAENGDGIEDEDVVEFIGMLVEKGLTAQSRGASIEKEEPGAVLPLKQVYFYLTEGCNLACRHCWLAPKLQDETRTYPTLPVDIFESVLEQALPLGLERVKLTGGEPLMHPQISTLLEIVREAGVKLTMETNAVLCTPELAKKIAACKGASVSVSLDGPDAQSHEWVRGIKGSFDAALAGIRSLSAAGIRPVIIATVMRSNRDQLEKIVRLAESLCARSVKFNLLLPTGRGENLEKNGQALTLKEMLELGEWVTGTLAKTTKLKLYYDLPPAFYSLSHMFDEDGRGGMMCGILEIIGVLANGHYALCGIGSHIPDLIFGDAAAHRLETTWKHNKVLSELRVGIPSRFEGICSKCHLERVCLGVCIAQNYYQSKSLWKSFWLCEEAFKTGIFPKTRMKPAVINQL